MQKYAAGISYHFCLEVLHLYQEMHNKNSNLQRSSQAWLLLFTGEYIEREGTSESQASNDEHNGAKTKKKKFKNSI